MIEDAKGEDSQVWNHLPITVTREIICNWKRQAAGRDRAALAKVSPGQMPLSLSLHIPHAASVGFSWLWTCPGGRENSWQSEGGQLGLTLASLMTSSLTVSPCWNKYFRILSQTDFWNMWDLETFLMKDFPLRASLNIDSSEEVCCWGNTGGYWKLNPSSGI